MKTLLNHGFWGVLNISGMGLFKTRLCFPSSRLPIVRKLRSFLCEDNLKSLFRPVAMMAGVSNIGLLLGTAECQSLLNLLKFWDVPSFYLFLYPRHPPLTTSPMFEVNVRLLTFLEQCKSIWQGLWIQPTGRFKVQCWWQECCTWIPNCFSSTEQSQYQLSPFV